MKLATPYLGYTEYRHKYIMQDAGITKVLDNPKYRHLNDLLQRVSDRVMHFEQTMSVRDNITKVKEVAHEHANNLDKVADEILEQKLHWISEWKEEKKPTVKKRKWNKLNPFKKPEVATLPTLKKMSGAPKELETLFRTNSLIEEQKGEKPIKLEKGRAMNKEELEIVSKYLKSHAKVLRSNTENYDCMFCTLTGLPKD